MVATLTVPFEEFEEGLNTGDQPAGLRLSHVRKCDDGTTVIGVLIFESEESYVAMADTPHHAEWYAANIAPRIVGEAVWHDGFWINRL
jgi:hypothetical protein